jgi:membrane-bound lytic murein transglycosylase B
MKPVSTMKQKTLLPTFVTCTTTIVILLLLSIAIDTSAFEEYRHFNSLKRRLVADGFEKQNIDNLYKDADVAFADKIAGSYFRHREGKLNYKQFTEKKAISKATAYMAEHNDALAKARKIYGVDESVITAILLVETRLGTYVGANPVVSTLSTIASLENHINRDILWREQLKGHKVSRKKYDRKAVKKARWAYKELKAFLTYTKREGLDPLTVVGSYAGAVGFAQFMPTNILSLGVDGNQDGSVDLFTHPDAIASIANYLKNSGWKPGLDRKKAYKVVWRYNHSRYYVNTVLDISDLLKG